METRCRIISPKNEGADVRYYPLFLNMTGRKCVVVGGGKVAERKVERLLNCGARVEVVGKTLTRRLAVWKQEEKLVHHDGDYREAFLPGAFLVIGATNDAEVNGEVATDARALGIPVNIVDDPARCDFILPSMMERGDLSIAVSTGGRSPALAKKLRGELEASYGPEYALLLEILGALRVKILAEGGAPAKNRARFETVVSSEILEKIRARRWTEAKEEIKKLTGVEMEVEPR